MRGTDDRTGALFSYLSPDAPVPADHPLRAIRPLVNAALERLSPQFSQLYSRFGRALLLLSVMSDPAVNQLLSNEHFSVDGTLIDAWASMKSFRCKDGDDDSSGPGRDAGREKPAIEAWAASAG